MAYSIHLGDDQILHVEYSGYVSYMERARALDDAAEWIDLHGVSGVLVDFTMAVVGDDNTRTDFLAKVIAHPKLDLLCVAIVTHQPASGEVARTAGLIRQLAIRVYAERERALDWLRTHDCVRTA
jgi:hypothetical protein